MKETKITVERLKHHFAYSLWKYVLVLVAVAVGWNLIYTTTAYRPPKDKKLSVYFVGGVLSEETTEWMRSEIMAILPELEDAQVLSIQYSNADYYGDMQLTTYIGAGEGDIYVLPRAKFDALKTEGAFLLLDEAIDTGAIDLQGVDVQSCVASDEEGNTGIVGIPAESLYGLLEYGLDNRDLVICVMGYAANQPAAFAFVDWLIEEMKAEKPEWVVEKEAQTPQNTTGTAVEMPSF